MPRLRPRILHQARKVDPLLPLVLQGTRDLASAKNELRWLREFIAKQEQNTRTIDDWSSRRKLRQLCADRAQGKPLQYIMGTEYFGDLEIACEPGVLIPRQETAASVTHLIERLHRSKQLPEHVKLLDLCTGTGCIPLLASHEFMQKHREKGRIEAVGVDISPRALSLARRNTRRLSQDGAVRIQPPRSSLSFIQADILAKDDKMSSDCVSLMTALHSYEKESESSDISTNFKGRWDILISNPPYVSPDAFNHTTTRSVKRYEPKLALVPSNADALRYPGIDPGDIFYPRLLEIAKQLGAQVVLFEVADLKQAGRVATMAQQQKIWTAIEIWRDDPSQSDGDADLGLPTVATGIKVRGRGNGRSVFAYRGDAKGPLSELLYLELHRWCERFSLDTPSLTPIPAIGMFPSQKGGSDAVERAEYIALPSIEGSLPTRRAANHHVKKRSSFWVKIYLFTAVGGILIWMAYVLFLSVPSRAEYPVAAEENPIYGATAMPVTITVRTTVTSTFIPAPSSLEPNTPDNVTPTLGLNDPILGPMDNSLLLYHPALPAAKSTSRLGPLPINTPPTARPRTPLFISFTRNNAMLLQTVHSYIISGWPASDIMIIDNSGTMDANPSSLLSASNPFYLDYRTLREDYRVSILQAPTLLSFSQLQNFYIRTAISMDWEYFFWSHMDIVVLPSPSQPYKSFYASVQEVLRKMTLRTEEGEPWALRFFNYDFLTLVNVDAMKAIGAWDTFIPYYASDCDFYARVYASGYDTPASVKVDAGKIYDVPSPVPDFAAKLSAVYTSHGVDEKAYSALSWELEKAQRFKNSDQGAHRNSWQGMQKGGQGEMWTYDAEGFEKAWWMMSRSGGEVFKEKWGRGDCELWKKKGWSVSEAWKEHGVS